MKKSLEGAWPVPDESHVHQAVDKLVNSFKPLRIIAFGSYAQGTARHGSDLDLLVVLSNVHDKRKTAVAMRRALADLPVPKDVFVATPAEIERRGSVVGSVLREALTHGSIVYEQVHLEDK